MALTNQDRVGKGLEFLKDGLVPFVERELKAQDAQGWLSLVRQSVADTQTRLFKDDTKPKWDAASVLAVLWNQWNTVFRKTLGQAERSIVSELRDTRNRWAHQEPISGDDADRALDSIARLLTAVSATAQAEEVNKMKLELRRVIYEEQVRGEKRKTGGSLIEAAATGALKPWREVVTPHADVASGRYQQAEFAADLWQVYLGEGGEEYRDPKEFFRRTFLTESLRRLLVTAARRLTEGSGDPVIQLQTNFGGGKTHSMLALYHMFSGASHRDLLGLDEILLSAGVKSLPKANRVVLVGNKLTPGNPSKKKDGTVVRTLWGELAYQLGGKKAFDKVKEVDANATNPGDVLRELFNEYGPCLILIDEWVAYARQLHDQADLPAGNFDTQFSFAQALTESAKLAKNCLLVVSLPASEATGSPHTQTDDVEVGGVRGREALDRIRNVVGRVESSWRPATAEEGFEIVRRRLFVPLAEKDFKQRDLTAAAFAELYRANANEFPRDVRTADYEKRIQQAYPIHPEIFDRLYNDWSTLIKFQRTRGVLRLMAAVIHSLWEKGDRSPLILPSTIPIDDARVQPELLRYLPDHWGPVIESDIDGPNSLPMKIDGELAGTLGKYSATRRVARTVYLGSAPNATAAHRGIEDRQVRLGCVMPGEPIAVFGDALRRLAAQATYLYQEDPRVWYSTKPTVTKLADDKAEQLKNSDRVLQELERRLKEDLLARGDFYRIHTTPRVSADVPDELEARLVVLGPDAPYSKEADSPAEAAARAILESRGTAPRIYRNTLVFLAADKVRYQDLDEAIRKSLAWGDILREKEEQGLDLQQVRQAESRKKADEAAVLARLPETYFWLLVPTQVKPDAPVEFVAKKLSGGGELAVRASKKLRSEEALLKVMGPSFLRGIIDKIPLWRGDHVRVQQLVEEFAQYTYLPRLAEPSVMLQSIAEGVKALTWQTDGFAYADDYDEKDNRYRGLRAQQVVTVSGEGKALVVKPEIARAQLDKEEALPLSIAPPPEVEPGVGGVKGPPSAKALPKRFYGTVELNSERVGLAASKIADEVISHLAGIVGAEVKVTLEIEASIPSGASEQVVRTVTENSRALKFTTQSFEKE